MSRPLTSALRTLTAGSSRRAPTLSIPHPLIAGSPQSPFQRYNSTTSSSPTRPCPKCGTPTPAQTTPCPTCNTLLPLPDGLSHHSLLGLSTPIIAPAAFSTTFDLPAELAGLPAHGFHLDPRDLRSRMLQSQVKLHPDRFGSLGERVVLLARDLSGRVNEAYGTLADPLKRAEYILGIHAQTTEESDSLTDPMLLAEILEAREELESATTEDEVAAIRETNSQKVEATIRGLHEAFSADPPNLPEAKDLAVQLKYWQGLEKAAKEWTPPS